MNAAQQLPKVERQTVRWAYARDTLVCACYLGFNRCIVSSLALVALVGVFLLPQTTEVLHGMGDDIALLGAAGSQLATTNSPPVAVPNSKSLFAYSCLVAMSVLLASMLYIGTQLTARPHPRQVPAFFAEYAERRLPHWGHWFAVTVAVASLVIVHGAFLRTQLTVPLLVEFNIPRHWTPIVNVASYLYMLAPLAALVLVVRRWGWWIGATVAATLWLAASVFYFHYIGRAGWGIFSVVCSAALPTLVYAASELPSMRSWPTRRPRATLFGLALYPVAVMFGASSWLSALPEPGSAALMLLYLSSLFSIALLFGVALRWFSRDVPGFALLVAGLTIWGLNSLLDERYGSEWLPSTAVPFAIYPSSTLPLAKQGQGNWGAATEGRFVAVHADGGGLRAAYFTAMVLAGADDATCGKFGDRLYAASGVSGGSLGIAAWSVLRRELVLFEAERGAGWKQACERQTAAARYEQGTLRKLMARTLVQDHLSGPLVKMLSTDAAPSFSLPAARGQALLDSWQQAAKRALKEASLRDSQTQAFAQPLQDADAGNAPGRWPWLLFNATDARTGERIMQSNGNPLLPFAKGPRSPRAQVGLAALDSARFPIVSPAGVADSSPKARKLVDGGYFDNSGAASLQELLTAQVPKPPGVMRLVRLDGNAPEPDAESSSWTGLAAFMRTRKAHADEAVESLRRLVSPFVQGTFTAGTRYEIGNPLRLSYAVVLDANCNKPRYSIQPPIQPLLLPPDSQRICAEAKRQAREATLRQAPLGWYSARRPRG